MGVWSTVALTLLIFMAHWTAAHLRMYVQPTTTPPCGHFPVGLAESTLC